MLSFITNTINLLRNIIYWTLLFSYKIGQSIAFTITFIFTFLIESTRNVLSALKIFYEDFGIFLSDLFQSASLILNWLGESVNTIFVFTKDVFEGVKTAYFSLNTTLTVIIDSILNFWNKLFNNIGQILICIRTFLTILGSGVWFALTLIPIGIIYTFTLFISYIRLLFAEIFNIIINCKEFFLRFLRECYYFISEIPAESYLGLIAGACLIYITLKWYFILYGIFRRFSRHLYEGLIRNLSHMRSHIFRSNSNLNVTPDESSEVESENEGDGYFSEERFCIICQERDKCILFLPCKHVCLCSECNLVLKRYNRACPICRTVINRTMKIFV